MKRDIPGVYLPSQLDISDLDAIHDLVGKRLAEPIQSLLLSYEWALMFPNHINSQKLLEEYNKSAKQILDALREEYREAL